MLDLLPTLIFLALVAWFLLHNDSRPVVQVYVVIVVSYLNVFPALDFLFSSGQSFEMEGFARFQLFIIGFFQLPLLVFLNRTDRGLRRSTTGASDHPRHLRLSAMLPLFLAGLLMIFWFVSLRYNLFFVRLGYQGVQDAPPDIPLLFIYPYRAAVETSFFVTIFLFCTLRATVKKSRYRGVYKALLIGYLLTFLIFFAVNSRMQFLLLILCLLCTQVRADFFSLRSLKVPLIGIAAFVLVIGLTLLREIFIENNGRLDTTDALTLIQDVGRMIASRLDSLVMLNALSNTEFNPFGFQWSGLMHVVNFNIAFFIDPQTYAEIKASEVTSPSVEIVNRLLLASEVDFPKSMILDVFLIFGVYGLFLLGIFLGRSISKIQRQTLRVTKFSTSFVVAIYALPMLLQFEKEFLGFLISFLKWAPILLLVVYLKPRETSESKSQLQTPPPALLPKRVE